MLRKLYSLVSGATGADNPDSPQHHEVLLPGFLYGMIIKERLEEALTGVRMQIVQEIRQNKSKPFTDCKSPETTFLDTLRKSLTDPPQLDISQTSWQRPIGMSGPRWDTSSLPVISSRHRVSTCNRLLDTRLSLRNSTFTDTSVISGVSIEELSLPSSRRPMSES